jgi:hypothetical protein
MVSSSVYGLEDELNQIFAILKGFGYNVWMSHVGSVPSIPGKSALESCLIAVERCHFFLGIIRTRYGSGRADSTTKSITHLELLKAIELNKPRFFIADEKVVIARRLLMDVGFEKSEGRGSLRLKKGAQIIDDLKVLDMYEDAIQDGTDLDERKDNWVQSFRGRDELFRIVNEQFNRYADLHKQLISPAPSGKGRKP